MIKIKVIDSEDKTFIYDLKGLIKMLNKQFELMKFEELKNE